MKRAIYSEAIAWIGENECHDEMSDTDFAGLISVLLVADLFALEALEVVRDVRDYRADNFKPYRTRKGAQR